VLCTELLGTLDDLDRVLSTDANFMLGPWIAAARAWGNTTAESDLYEWNARNQLTLWGPSGLSNVVDYATKEWGGLTSSFFKPRWQLFCAHLLDSEDGMVDQVAVNEALLAKVEQPWQHMTMSTQLLPTAPTEDALTVAAAMLAKYGGAERASSTAHVVA
jgi:alpha-N-acetylglucosaminidase